MRASNLLVLFVGLALGSGELQAQTVSVGWDDDCDYDVRIDANAINTALLDGNSEVRVSNENDYLNAVLVTDSVILKGAYANCAAANADTPSATHTRIDGTSILPSALKIYSSGAAIAVSVYGFTIENATGSQDGGPDFNVAAGVAIVGTGGQVTLTNLLINDNDSEFWSGGLSIHNDLGGDPPLPLLVNLTDTLITNNSGGASGGGLSCHSGGYQVELNISGQSGISFNHTDQHGGGIFVDRCRVNMSSGTANPGLADPRGIHKNTANGSGGGIAMFSESPTNLTGNQQEPVNITENQANLDLSGTGDGGGLYLSGPSVSITAERVLIAGNFTDKDGGGVYLEGGASLSMKTDHRGCNWNPLCGQISGNRANFGGAIHLESGSHVQISGLEAFANRANSGTLFSMFNDNNSISIETALLHHNGNPVHSDYSDDQLIRNVTGDNTLAIDYSTIVDNDIQGSTLGAFSGTAGTLSVWFSIIDDPGIPPSSFVTPGQSGVIHCSMVNDKFPISEIATDHVFEETPVFVDRPNQDYHLTAPPNTALDQCQDSVGTPPSPDVDDEIRFEDLPDVANGEGPIDIGYDEFVPPDTELIFASGFEQ